MSRPDAPFLLGLAGPKGVGKSTLAAALAKQTGATETALADAIKTAALRWWPRLSGAAVHGPSELREQPVPGLGRWVCSVNAAHSAIVRSPAPSACPICGAPNPERAAVTPRWLLQRLGTEVGRSIDPDVWVNLVVSTARRDAIGAGRDTVVSDVRFDNEARAILAAEYPPVGYIALLRREGTDYTGEHASEVGLGAPDVVQHPRFRVFDVTPDVREDVPAATRRVAAQIGDG